MTIGGQIVLDYLVKYPKLPSRTLSLLIYSHHKIVFKNAEAIRAIIRYYRGSSGEARLSSLAVRDFLGFEGSCNPFDALPEGLKSFDDWAPFIITGKKALIISDIHVPYHDRESLMIALKKGKDEKADTIIINGDFCDFYSISFWEKDPRKRDFAGEVMACKVVLETIRRLFPKQKIIFKVGNHEERYERFMKLKAPELLGIDAFKLEEILDFKKYSVEIVPDKRIIKIGRLNIVHGHEFGKALFSPVNPARGLYMKGKAIALCGHYHVTSNHNEKTMGKSTDASI